MGHCNVCRLSLLFSFISTWAGTDVHYMQPLLHCVCITEVLEAMNEIGITVLMFTVYVRMYVCLCVMLTEVCELAMQPNHTGLISNNTYELLMCLTNYW